MKRLAFAMAGTGAVLAATPGLAHPGHAALLPDAAHWPAGPVVAGCVIVLAVLAGVFRRYGGISHG